MAAALREHGRRRTRTRHREWRLAVAVGVAVILAIFWSLVPDGAEAAGHHGASGVEATVPGHLSGAGCNLHGRGGN